MTGRELYLGALGLGDDLTPAEDAAVRARAAATFRTQATVSLTEAQRMAAAAAAKAAAAKRRAAATPATPAPSTKPAGPSLWEKVKASRWLLPAAAGTLLIGGAAAYKMLGGHRPEKPNPDDDRDATDFYKEFHWGRRPNKRKRIKLGPRPRRLVQLGRLESVTYSALKGGDPVTDYVHKFERPRPMLACDPKTKRLHVLGGGYTVEERGIVG